VFDRVVDRFLNGARTTAAVISVNAENPGQLVFTSSQGVQPGKTLEVVYDAVIDPSQAPGVYHSTVGIDV
jgi:hypothetical protein